MVEAPGIEPRVRKRDSQGLYMLSLFFNLTVKLPTDRVFHRQPLIVSRLQASSAAPSDQSVESSAHSNPRTRFKEPSPLYLGSELIVIFGTCVCSASLTS